MCWFAPEPETITIPFVGDPGVVVLGVNCNISFTIKEPVTWNWDPEVKTKLLLALSAVPFPIIKAPGIPTNGMVIVSGSGVDQHIYCYLNSTWKQLD